MASRSQARGAPGSQLGGRVGFARLPVLFPFFFCSTDEQWLLEHRASALVGWLQSRLEKSTPAREP
jgi:hypothetical protein